MKKYKHSKIAMTGCALACTVLCHAQKQLTVGDPAPAIKVAAWIKGEPVTSFQPGTIYVIDFWATWCGPCNASMPHMSELARKFKGKVVVIGVDISEKVHPGTDLERMVSDFVKKKGDNMDYTVCMDDMSSKLMATCWMGAAKQTGIPSVFIIDQKGIIADMLTGYSDGDHSVDDDVSKLIAGTFDPKTSAGAPERDRAEENRKKMAPFSELLEAIETQRKLKSYARVVQMIDVAMAKDPKLETLQLPFTRYYLTVARFSALAHVNPNQAYELAEKAKGTKQIHYAIATGFAEEENLQKRFYDYSIDFFETEFAANEMFPAQLPQLYFYEGQPEKSAEYESKLIDLLRRRDPDMDLSDLEAKLKEYQQAAAKHRE